MAKEFKPDSAIFGKVSGLYSMSDNAVIEFYPDATCVLPHCPFNSMK